MLFVGESVSAPERDLPPAHPPDAEQFVVFALDQLKTSDWLLFIVAVLALKERVGGFGGSGGGGIAT